MRRRPATSPLQTGKLAVARDEGRDIESVGGPMGLRRRRNYDAPDTEIGSVTRYPTTGWNELER